MSKGSKRRNGTGYEDEHERIFGKKAPSKGGQFVQDPTTHKLVPKAEYIPPERSAAIHAEFEGFKSPIDGAHITDRAQLRAHNKKHGVTDSRDYSVGYYENKQKERERSMSSSTTEQKQERINTIKRAIHQHSR